MSLPRDHLISPDTMLNRRHCSIGLLGGTRCSWGRCCGPYTLCHGDTLAHFFTGTHSVTLVRICKGLHPASCISVAGASLNLWRKLVVVFLLPFAFPFALGLKLEKVRTCIKKKVEGSWKLPRKFKLHISGATLYFLSNIP